MADIKELEKLCATYAYTVGDLDAGVQALQAAMRTLKQKHLPALKRSAESAAKARTALKDALGESRELFAGKRRSVVLHGVKVGFKKDKGKVEMSDEAAVIARIRKLLPANQAELLIRVEESVHKPAVYDLSVEDLKRLGIEIKDTGDQPVMKLVNSDVEKLVDALLNGGEAEVK